MGKWWYLKVRLKYEYRNRKIWFMNDNYLCDCVNLPFKDKKRCEMSISEIRDKFGDNIESITLHWTRK